MEQITESAQANRIQGFKRFWRGWLLVLIAIAAIAAGYWAVFVSQQPVVVTPESRPSTPVETQREEIQTGTSVDETFPDRAASGQAGDVESPTAPTLPDLDDSDTTVREQVAILSNNTTLVGWMKQEGVIRKWVLLVDNLSRGVIPRKGFDFLAPKQSFPVIAHDETYRLDPKGYQRYKPHAEAIASINEAEALRLYQLLKPILNQAYEELGYPGSDVDSALLQAIDRILATPLVEKEILLVRPTVTYKFADAKLETLGALEKQLIRMGPENTRLIQDKLRRFAALLRSSRGAD